MASWQTLRMLPARLAAAAALLGGLTWIAHALLGGGTDPLPATLHVVGLVLVNGSLTSIRAPDAQVERTGTGLLELARFFEAAMTTLLHERAPRT